MVKCQSLGLTPCGCEKESASRIWFDARIDSELFTSLPIGNQSCSQQALYRLGNLWAVHSLSRYARFGTPNQSIAYRTCPSKGHSNLQWFNWSLLTPSQAFRGNRCAILCLLKKFDFRRDEEVGALMGNSLVHRTRSSRRNICIVGSICHVYIHTSRLSKLGYFQKASIKINIFRKNVGHRYYTLDLASGHRN